VFDEDGSNGFVLPVQNLGGVQEKVLAGDLSHGTASGIVTAFSWRRGSGAIGSAQLQDRVCAVRVAGNADNCRPNAGRRAAGPVWGQRA
jgi:hypothetical protein